MALNLLWRSNPRLVRRGTSFVAVVARRSEPDAPRNVAESEYFGLFGPYVAGQGSQTSDLSATITTSGSATIVAGQGSQTSDIVATILSDAAIDAGQGSQTSDGVVIPGIVAVVDAGQGSDTSDIVGTLVDFQAVQPQSWWDGANAVTHGGAPFWSLNPRFAPTGMSRTHQLVPYFTFRLIGSTAIGVEVTGTAANRIANALQFNKVPWTEYTEGFGSHLIRLTAAQVVVAPSINDGTFGLPNVYNETITAAVDAGQGSQTSDIAAASLSYTQYISPSGFRADAVGLVTIQNDSRAVLPPRIEESTVPSPVIVGPRYIEGVTLGETSSLGTPLLDPRYILHDSLDDSIVSTQGVVSNAERTVVATSVDAGLPGFGYPAVSDGLARQIYVEAIEEPEFFGPIIGIDPFAVIELVTLDDLVEFGDVTVVETASPPVGTTRYIRAIGVADGSIGTVRMEPVQLLASGINAGSIGTQWVSNYIRYVRPASINATRYGTHWISNYIRYLVPTGIDESIVWDDFGPVDEDGNRARVYNEFSDDTGVVLAGGLDSISFGTARVRDLTPCGC
jgi:hypothetical protein